ncbi:indolepyruvate ferredoxin oxidoreductase [Variovorax sp. PBL-H6]|nr:indolepyruvate ferredoxin oxidoreductase [Variovorax sp. PBL-H6]
MNTATSLDDKYTAVSGLAYMNGTHALVRLPMLQRERDAAAGLDTAGFISGYRGSPLGGYDQALQKAKQHLDRRHVSFMPGVNEELAATAVWGTQQANLRPGAKYDGVFGIWYGKGPGVDRSADVFRHANQAGTSAHGGVLALAGASVPAASLAAALLGDAIAANAFLLGFAWQKGLVPLAAASIERAIELNAVAVEMNRQAFRWGRAAAAVLPSVQAAARPAQVIQFVPRLTQTLEQLVEHRAGHLMAYQSAALAARYRAFVERVAQAESALGGGRRLAERSAGSSRTTNDSSNTCCTGSTPAITARPSRWPSCPSRCAASATSRRKRSRGCGPSRRACWPFSTRLQ